MMFRFCCARQGGKVVSTCYSFRMPVRDIERELEELSGLRTLADADVQVRALGKALRDKVNVVVARAAKITGELQIRSLIPDLCTAYDSLFTNPLKSDPKCWGKEALAKALQTLGYADSPPFIKGSRHVQLEPVWGGEEDTAANLRSICSLALLQCLDLTREDKLWAVVPLLTEASPSLRRDAALALEIFGGRESALLLRLKARMGDEDLAVAGQVFESLLRIEGAQAVPFVAELMRTARIEMREESALALGASRLPEAVAALQDASAKKPSPPVALEVIYRALGLSRQETAAKFLLEALRKQRPDDALIALDALKLFLSSADVREEVNSIIQERSEPELVKEWARISSALHA